MNPSEQRPDQWPYEAPRGNYRVAKYLSGMAAGATVLGGAELVQSVPAAEATFGFAGLALVGSALAALKTYITSHRVR